MKTVIELNEQDIEDIIAKHFAPCEVDISIKSETVGYGLGEHEKYLVEAIVIKEGEVDA